MPFRIFAMRPTAVLFDLDGTLADTAGDLGGALNRMRASRQLPPLPIDMLRAHASAGARGLIEAGLQIMSDAPNFEDLRQEFLQHYTECLADTTVLFDDVAQLLDKLDAAACPWGIVTNKPHRFTVPVVEALGLATRAGSVISGDSTAHAKPHPLPLLVACQHMGLDPATTLYVGDDLRDIQAAKAAGMPSVAAAWGYLGTEHHINEWGADVICKSPLDLLPILV